MRSSRLPRLRCARSRILTAGLAVLVAVAIPTLAGAGHQTGSVTSYTGCLTTPALGGLVYFVKVGDTPSATCKSGHTQIHLSGGDITAVAAGTGLEGGATNGSATISLVDGGVTSAKLAAGAVTQPKIAGSAVGSAEVADGSLGTAEFATSIPAVRVTHSAAQSTVPGGAVAFDSERYDTANMHDTSTNNSRLTAPVTGIYVITASVLWAPGPAGLRIIDLRRNGSPVIDNDSRLAPPAPQHVGASITTLARLEAGDYVEVVIDGSLDILKNGEASPEFAMTWLAPGP